MRSIVTTAAVFMAALLLTSCYTPKKEQDLDETLLQYEQMIRWSQWDGAVNMLAPEYLEKHAITNLDMQRLRLFRTTQYIIRSALPFEDGNSYQQVVEIRMFNKTRATEKIVMDSQEWKYDEDTERWFLHSGLPDVSKRY